MLHFLHMFSVNKTRDTVINNIGEDKLNDLLELEILNLKGDMVMLNAEHRETIFQVQTFEEFMIRLYDKYKQEDRVN